MSATKQSTAKLKLASHIPGRLRVRGFGTGIEAPNLDQILAITGVTETTYRRGSLLVLYDVNRITPPLLLEALCSLVGAIHIVKSKKQDLGGSTTADDENSSRPDLPVDALSQQIYGLAEKGNASVHQALGGRADLSSLVPAAVVALAVFELARTPVMPKWYDIMREGLDQFRYYHKDEPDNALARGIYDTAKGLNDSVRQALGGRADLTSIVPASLVIVALAELARTPVMPKWYDFLKETLSELRFHSNRSINQESRPMEYATN